MNKIVLENGSVIINSLVRETTKCFKNVSIINSEIFDDCTIGDNSRIVDSKLQGANVINRNNLITNSNIEFGTYTGHNITIKDTIIGKFCSLSWNLSIGGKNHKYKSATCFPDFHWNRILNHSTIPIESDLPKTQIGNDVWIGNGAIILRGISIGDGAIIGAGAVVTKDIEPYTIVAGVPAKPIKKRFNDDLINELLKIKWWNWEIDTLKRNRDLLTMSPLTLDLIKKLEE